MRKAFWITMTWMLAGAPLPGQEDPLARARELYASAAYEEVLTELERAASGDRGQTESLKAFCLLALGRRVEGEAAFRSLIEADPTFRLDDGAVSPAVQSVFAQVRVALLPTLIERTYTSAKAAFEEGDRERARVGFERVLAFVAEAADRGLGVGADLKLVAAGFLDLLKLQGAAQVSRAAATPSTTERVTPNAAIEPPPAPAVPDSVVPPAAIQQTIPPWLPPNAQVADTTFRGVIEVLVNEHGDVVSATIVEPVHPAYDRTLVAAARGWKYQPARRGGRPTSFVKRVEVVLKGR